MDDDRPCFLYSYLIHEDLTLKKVHIYPLWLSNAVLNPKLAET